ncbi:MAG: NAD-dependent epimerase/dehydratase family protein [Acidobacteriota bacterium]
MPQIAITGAAGHIGGVLVRRLVAAGERPRVLVRSDRRALDGLAVDEVAGDVRDPASLAVAFRDAGLVIHLAAHVSVDGRDEAMTRAINVDGVRNVVQACLGARVKRLVHFSSIDALSPVPRDEIVDEGRALSDGDRVPHYDRSKALGERAVLDGVARGLDAVIVNPTGVIGPFDFRPSHMGEVLLRLATRSLPGLVDGAFDWVDVRDVAASALSAAERGATGERYLLPGHRASLREIARLASEATGVPVPRLVAPMWLARAGLPIAAAYERLRGRRSLFTADAMRALENDRRVSGEKAARALGHAARPLRTTIADTYAWFGSQGLVIARA